MRLLWAVAQRDLRVAFSTVAGYAVPVLFALLSQGLFFGVYGFFDVGQAELRGFFHTVPWLVIFLAPALAMGGFAGERARGTEEALMALPIPAWAWVGGKFAAGMVQIGLCVLATFSLPVSLGLMGDPDWGPVWAGYGGVLLLAGASLAICQLVSNCLRSAAVAFLGGAAVLLLWMLAGSAQVIYMIAHRLEHPLLVARVVALLDYVGWVAHLASFERGVVDARDLTYFAWVTGSALVLNAGLLLWRRLP